MLLDKIIKQTKEIVFVYTTCVNRDEARNISLSAVEGKLAISADYWFINSIYPWKNVIQEIDQYMIAFVTEEGISDELIKHIEFKHSYDVPMITKCPILFANNGYLSWLNNNLFSHSSYVTEEESRILQKKNKQSREYHFEKLK